MPVLPDSISRATICGFPVLTGPEQQVTAQVVQDITQGAGAWVLTLNLDILAAMQRHPSYAHMMKDVDYATADGMPIVWSSKWHGPRINGRTTGIELARAILTAAGIERIALVGGTDPHEVARRFSYASRSYLVRDGNISFSEAYAQALAADLITHRTQVVLLALGVPKQDYFAGFIRRHVPGITVIGIGGGLEALLGLRQPTPVFLQNAGLEWLFRLACEPRRLWRRYLLHYPYGILLLIQASWLKRERCQGQ